MKPRVVALCLFLALASLAARAVPIGIVIDTTPLSGTQVDLAFDFTDGGPPVNSVTIADFTTDGSLGPAPSPQPDATTGTLPGDVELQEGLLPTEYRQSITLGSFIAFSFDTTGLTAEIGSFPDGFAFSILDPNTGLPLFDTFDVDGNPNPIGALVQYSIGEASPLALFHDESNTIFAREGFVTVPEPGALQLAIAALLALSAVIPVSRPSRK